MKFIVEKEELFRGINIVQKAIPTRAVMPILKGILLIAEENSLKLVANDMQIGIETQLSARVIEPGNIVVDSKVFGDIIRKIKDETVEITVNEKQIVNIKCNDLEMKIKGFDGEEFPELPLVREDDFIVIPENILSKMIRQTVFAVSKTEALSIITGELIEIDNSSITMVATDMYRVAIRKHSFESMTTKPIKAIIPGNSLMEIHKLLLDDGNREIRLALGDKHALFVIGRTKLVTRLLNGEYLNYKSTIPTEFSTSIRLKVSDLLYALEIASVFAQDKLVRINITDHKLRVSSDTEVGNIVKEVDIDLDGEDLEIGFNIRYLIEVLKVIDSEEIDMHFSSNRSPGLIKTIERNQYEYLVLPVRMHSPSAE